MDAPRHPVAPDLPIAAPADSLPATPAEVVDAVWTAIERGAAERWTPWGLPTLATTGPAGEPQARILALRGVERATRTLWFHTDRRSAKVSALKRDARASVLFWSADDAVEVRLDGTVSLHLSGRLADAAWDDASPLSRSAAAIALAPGTPLGAPTAFEALVQEGVPAMARSHFAAVAFVADRLDWLWIGSGDLRRARFQWIGRDWNGGWVVP
jgi:pyridoxamine 5'-phosphate oxidase